jgi:hypothetical protein
MENQVSRVPEVESEVRVSSTWVVEHRTIRAFQEEYKFTIETYGDQCFGCGGPSPIAFLTLVHQSGMVTDENVCESCQNRILAAWEREKDDLS